MCHACGVAVTSHLLLLLLLLRQTDKSSLAADSRDAAVSALADSASTGTGSALYSRTDGRTTDVACDRQSIDAAEY